VVFVPAGALCVLANGNWRGAILWIALSGLYVLAQPRIAKIMALGQTQRWAPATQGLLGTTVLSAGPIIAAGSDLPIGAIVDLIMLAAGVRFLIAGYAASPRLGLLVALPCVLAAGWITFLLTGSLLDVTARIHAERDLRANAEALRPATRTAEIVRPEPAALAS
jgi:hypothetical protein